MRAPIPHQRCSVADMRVAIVPVTIQCRFAACHWFGQKGLDGMCAWRDTLWLRKRRTDRSRFAGNHAPTSPTWVCLVRARKPAAAAST
jgi:hypothetical protein